MTPDSVLRVAAIQTVSGTNVAANLAQAEALIAQAATAGAQIVCLPEYFCILGRNGFDKVQVAEQLGNGLIQQFLCEQAQKHQIMLVGGTVPLVSEQDGKVFNSCLVFDRNGNQAARYDKIHLFGLNHQGERFDESQTIVPGAAAVAFDVSQQSATWRIGLSICYDLRFPELFRALSPPGQRCDIVFVPSAFTYTTGQAHWELLLRSRAVENQCYVVASAQGGHHENGRRTWGHSMVVDPWGTVLSCQSEGQGVVLADLSLQTIAQIRVSLPSLSHQKMNL